MYDLGNVPARFGAVEFANQPSVTREVTVNSQSALNSAIRSGTRIIVQGGSYSGITISGGQRDVEFVISNSATFSGGIVINNGERIRINGGDFNGGWNTALIQTSNARHVTLDNVNLANGLHLSSYDGAPHHVTVMNSTIRNTDSHGYGILGDTSHFIVANCDISNVPATQAGIRMIPARSMIVVDSRIYTSGNRIFRLHAGTSGGADSDLVLLARNQFESDADHNLWLAPTSGVDHANSITRVEFHNNRYYAPRSGISGAIMQSDSGNGGGIRDVVYGDNVHYSPDSAVTHNPPTGYVQYGNSFSGYRNPPAFSGGANH